MLKLAANFLTSDINKAATEATDVSNNSHRKKLVEINFASGKDLRAT